MNTFYANNLDVIPIGKQGENEVTEVIFNYHKWTEEFGGGGTVSLVHQRSEDLVGYPCDVESSDNLAHWLVRESDTAYCGKGKLVWSYTVAGKIVRTAIKETYVSPTLYNSEEAPEEYQPWLDKVLSIGAVYVGPTEPADENYKVWIKTDGEPSTIDASDVVYREGSTVEEALDDILSNQYVIEPETEGTSGQVLATDGEGGRYWKTVSGGGGGTSNYEELDNLPQINGATIIGNKSAAALGLANSSHGHSIPQIDQLSSTLNGKQDKLVSGSNIKTINSQSLLGSGNIVIQGGGGESGVQDVVVDGSSVVTDGIATIPKAGSSNLGVVGVKSVGYSPGIMMDGDGYIKLYSASDAQINGRSAAVFGFNASQIDKIVKAALTDGVGADYSDSEKASARTRIGAASANNVSAIESLIPAQATALNQLADQNFVNSSISTNTATYRGKFNSVEDLPTTGITPNDYAFVETTDSAGNTIYTRYKYASGTWQEEYELNNSSFTAAQWASIQSGITASLVSSISGKYVKPGEGIPKTDLESSVQTSLGLADTALQEHQSLSAYRTASSQDALDAVKTRENPVSITGMTQLTASHRIFIGSTDPAQISASDMSVGDLYIYVPSN